MEIGIRKRFSHWITQVLMKDVAAAFRGTSLYDFDQLCFELRPGDVLLNEGRSRVAEVIKLATQSSWTHSVLYIGRLYDIEDTAICKKVQDHYTGDPKDQLIIESLLGEGTIISPLANYRDEHIRICRPKGLSPRDAQQVIGHAVNQLGLDYDIRHVVDLMRFIIPYSILPRRWRSSLFTKNPGRQTRTVCSSMLAEAFHSVKFPIMPFAEKMADGKIHLLPRNPRLYTPKDFDFSPYFEIIKYPFFGLDDVSIYKRLPWEKDEIYCNDVDDCYVRTTQEPVKPTNNSEFPQFKTVNIDIMADKETLSGQAIKNNTH